MTLTLHHLRHSQSERIVWLAEELGIDYKLVVHKRDPWLAPQSIKDLHPAGTAPVMVDDPSPVTGSKVVIAESGAIVEYIATVYGKGRLLPTPKDGPVYVNYLDWFHFSNGTIQPAFLMILIYMRAKGISDTSSPELKPVMGKWDHALEMLEARLSESGAYVAGDDLTAADIMLVTTLTTMRGFVCVSFDEQKHKNILAYLARIGERPAYQNANKLCEGDDFKPMLSAKVEPFTFT